MAGLYIHIPFCREACIYCDFHFSISLGQLDSMLEAIRKELQDRRDFLEGEELQTIYMGGGTPSVVSPAGISLLMDTIRENYTVSKQIEITLEGNPDDLDLEYLSSLRQTGVNRLSIGIQSFYDEYLKFMNRRHDAIKAKTCLEEAYNAGFDNLSIDLIYGLPGMTGATWNETLLTALAYQPPHIAAYHLTYEPGTVLNYLRQKGKISPVDENGSIDQFTILVEQMSENGYQHYEISNFALPGYMSKHNSAYWKGAKYLGIGPSAHSYNGTVRRWNISGNSSYIRRIFKGNKTYEEEIINDRSRFHEYLLTSLRTMWGTDTEHIKNTWGQDYHEHVLRKSSRFIKEGKIKQVDNRLILSDEGKFLADYIIRELFL
jgi:oxygen-independent coproporphyrinogen-3 oxidase